MSGRIPRSRRMVRLLAALSGASLELVTHRSIVTPVGVDELQSRAPGLHALLTSPEHVAAYLQGSKSAGFPVAVASSLPPQWSPVIVKGRRSRSVGIERSETLDDVGPNP